jgi:hypothetical protein
MYENIISKIYFAYIVLCTYVNTFIYVNLPTLPYIRINVSR